MAGHDEENDEGDEGIEWEESSEEEVEEKKEKGRVEEEKKQKQKQKQKEKSSRAEIVEDILEQIADEGGNVNLSAVRELPEQLQYATLARLKDKRLLRENKRSEFIPVAADPMQYSHLQLKHFLKDSHFKRKLDRMEEDLTKRSGDGKKIASDPTREYILTDSVAPLKKAKLSTPKHSYSSSNQRQSIDKEKHVGEGKEEEPLVLTIPASNASAISAAAELFPADVFKNVAKERHVIETDEAAQRAALSSAMETASNLTSWAAHAVNHAIRARTRLPEKSAVVEVVDVDEGHDSGNVIKSAKKPEAAIEDGKVVDLASNSHSDDEIEWEDEAKEEESENLASVPAPLPMKQTEKVPTTNVSSAPISCGTSLKQAMDRTLTAPEAQTVHYPTSTVLESRENQVTSETTVTSPVSPDKSVPKVVEVGSVAPSTQATHLEPQSAIPENQCLEQPEASNEVLPASVDAPKPSHMPTLLPGATEENSERIESTTQTASGAQTTSPSYKVVQNESASTIEEHEIDKSNSSSQSKGMHQEPRTEVETTAIDESLDDLIEDEAAAVTESNADERELSKQAEEQLQADARQELVSEEARLVGSRNKAARDADGVTPAMLEDIKELLTLFGLPFIESPMEAEAQCAALECAGVVDGVVTDDCDAFLFGASNVYKNIFSDNKYVEAYKSKDISSQLGIEKKDMIALALLLGSDYTTGIKGIGIVNATEVISAFPGYDGLKEFREWVHSNQRQNIKKKKKKGKDGKAGGKGGEENVRRALFKTSHYNASKKWLVTETFPSLQVIAAYEQPTVCEVAGGGLKWKMPRKDAIVEYLTKQLRWSEEESLRKIKGPIDNYLKREVQTRLDSYFMTYNHKNKFAAIRSKRMQKAVVGMMGKSRSEGGEDDAPLFLDAVGNVVPAKPASPKNVQTEKQDKDLQEKTTAV